MLDHANWGGWVLTLILAVSVLLRLVFGEGLIWTDDFAYVNAALDANQAGWAHYLGSISSIYENRVSLVLPLALTLKLLGNTENAIASLSLLCLLGTILCAYSLGSVLRNRRAGLLAAMLVAFIPQEIWYSRSTLPDTFIPCYAGLALLSLALALRPGRQAARQTGLLLLSGLAVFLAFEARATSGILLLPLMTLTLWSTPGNRRVLLLPPAAFGGLLLLFWTSLGLLGGDFLRQYRLLQL